MVSITEVAKAGGLPEPKGCIQPGPQSKTVSLEKKVTEHKSLVLKT